MYFFKDFTLWLFNIAMENGPFIWSTVGGAMCPSRKIWELPNLVMTNSSPWKPWPIEIDGLPSYKMGGSFHGELLNNQLVVNGKDDIPYMENK